MYRCILITVPRAAVMSLEAGWEMLEGMIYRDFDGRSSQPLQIPLLAVVGGRSHLRTSQVDEIP